MQRGGGASELAGAFLDERLEWESREQAATLLQDLAAALLQDSAGEEGGGTSAAAASSSRPLRQAWRDAVLPALVGGLQQRRGQHLQASKEAAAGVLAKVAGNGPKYAADVW